MSKLIVSQDNEKIVLIDGTTIEIDTGMFGDPLGFIVTAADEIPDEGRCPLCQNPNDHTHSF